MPTRTVDQGFRDFLPKLTPTSRESTAAKNHRATIEACLKNNFGMTRFFRTGSLGNGTSISGYSDVDYFAQIPTENLNTNSTTTLRKVRNALDTRFPDTGVNVSCPAVVVPFGTEGKESTEVTPADYIGVTSDDNEYKVYEIPDCSDGWMRSSPDAHNAYVREVNGDLSNKVKPLIRFIKAWKYYRYVPISSFYLELRVAKYAEGESSIVYAEDMKRVFSYLDRIDLRDMLDPMNISGYISACSTDAKLEDAKSKLSTAISRSEKACDAEDNGDTEEAFKWWNLLYAYNFPSYRY
ncbi:MAG: nucleotidyltransferase [Candidatus Poribacteria bacterium]|nr:nucleotidyltransferase [Candidatus Poribacteria bacterium]